MSPEYNDGTEGSVIYKRRGEVLPSAPAVLASHTLPPPLRPGQVDLRQLLPSAPTTPAFLEVTSSTQRPNDIMARLAAYAQKLAAAGKTGAAATITQAIHAVRSADNNPNAAHQQQRESPQPKDQSYGGNNNAPVPVVPATPAPVVPAAPAPAAKRAPQAAPRKVTQYRDDTRYRPKRNAQKAKMGGKPEGIGEPPSLTISKAAKLASANILSASEARKIQMETEQQLERDLERQKRALVIKQRRMAREEKNKYLKTAVAALRNEISQRNKNGAAGLPPLGVLIPPRTSVTQICFHRRVAAFLMWFDHVH